MQINLPSRSCIRDGQEADTPTHGRSHGLWQRHGEGEVESSRLMLLVNFVVLHLLLCFNQWNARGEQRGGRERMNVKGESVCL